MIINRTIAVLLLMVVVCIHLHAQDLDSLLNLNAFTTESELQKILNKGTTTGSFNKLPLREAPGIMSLVTQEEIRLSGARDLIDVLRLVPGFDISHDIQLILGVNIRGAWANEGKVLFLLDGQPLNELLYQTMPLGNHIPVDAIERIEIIRGPGSAIYGGSAEYGVINIITQAAESQNGIRLYGSGGLHPNAVGRQNYGISLGGKKALAWDASVYGGKSIISDQTFQELDNEMDPQDLSSSSSVRPLNINAGISKGGFRARMMYDQYKSSDFVNYAYYKEFFTDLSYKFHVAPKIALVSEVKYYNQVPWAWGDNETKEPSLKAAVQRYQVGMKSSYFINRKINLDGGLVYFTDRADYKVVPEHYPENSYLNIDNFAVYMQGLLKHRLFNATAGFRYEKADNTNGSFVPRLALTKKIENFHFKALYSHSFRTPSIENFNLSFENEMKPEKSRIYELELGYQFTPAMLLTINGFRNSTKDIIVYYYNYDTEEDGYLNNSKFGTKGIEIHYGYKSAKGFLNLGYSYSESIKNTTTKDYHVPGHPRQFLGQLKNKMSLNGLYKINNKLSFNSSAIFGGNRFTYTAIDNEDELILEKIDEYLLINVYVQYSNLFPGLDVGVGTYDLLNEKPVFAQPYGGSAPVPGRSREIVCKISYNLNFK
jgi:outer membrane cobalamin receptor